MGTMLAFVPDADSVQRPCDDEREHQLLATIASLEAKLAERDALLDEVNHRAKNSLQMAMSLLHMQGESDGDARVQEALGRAAARLGHIATVHEMLYEHAPEDQSVELLGYLVRMRDALADAHQMPDIRVVVSGDHVVLDAQQAIRLALIAGEAVINAYKYAFPAGRGRIELIGRVTGDRGVLSIADDGVGFAVEARKGSLGMRLIRALARAAGGEAIVTSARGTRVTVSFPLKP